MTTAQVAAALQIHRSAVSRMPPGDLPFRRTPGGHRRYSRRDVERYLAGHPPARYAADPAADLVARVAALEEDVADLKAWRASRRGTEDG